MEKLRAPSAIEFYGYFIGQFESVIRPALDRKELELACIIIKDLLIRHSVVSQDVDFLSSQFGGYYLSTIAHLETFEKIATSRMGEFKESAQRQPYLFAEMLSEGEAIENIHDAGMMSTARRNIAQMDFMLKGRPEYEAQRNRRN